MKRDTQKIRVKEKILLGLRRGWSFSGACRSAGCSRKTGVSYRDEDPVFAIAVAEAKDEGIEGLEDIGVARAKRRSDPLLMFFLKAANRDKYGDRVQPLDVKPIEVRVKKF